MATLAEYVGSRDDYENMGTGAINAQSFQVTSNGTATAVEINGSKGNSASGTFKIEIRSTSPTGTVLGTTGTITTSSSSLAAFNAGGVDMFTSFSLTAGASLTTGVTYYFVLTALSGSASDEVRWNCDTTSPSYAGGSVVDASGTPSTGRDKLFRVTSTDPTGPTTVKTLNGISAI